MDTYKRAHRKFGDQGLFDSEERTSMLAALGNPLERLAGAVDFEMYNSNDGFHGSGHRHGTHHR